MKTGNVTGNNTSNVRNSSPEARMNDLTIIDIAKLAGVSVSTVSRVLNKHPDVSAKTCEKVMTVINHYGYIPNNSARNLKRESMKAVAVIVKGFSNPMFTAMLGIVQHELEKNNYTMILAQVETNQDEVDAAISLCKEKKPRGLIFMGGNFSHTRDKLARLDIPLVMLTITMHTNVDRNTFSSVTVDDRAAGYAVGQAMIKNGHKRLAAIGSNADDVSISRLRIEGFRRAKQEAGMQDSDDQIAYAGEFSYCAGYEAAKALMQKADFTCLFCISDIIAVGAIRAMHDAGLSVPGDISVIGFDGIEEGRYFIPSLATMKQPETRMAHESVSILLNHIRSGAGHRHELFEAVFSPGESFAPRI